MSGHWINCDAKPHVRQDLKYRKDDQVPGRIRGKILWEKSKAGLWLSRGQGYGKMIRGATLLDEIKTLEVPVYPVQVFDFLLKNPEQIPNAWKSNDTYFWTPFYDGTSIVIPFLCWKRESWISGYKWIGFDWYPRDPAAVQKPL